MVNATIGNDRMWTPGHGFFFSSAGAFSTSSFTTRGRSSNTHSSRTRLPTFTSAITFSIFLSSPPPSAGAPPTQCGVYLRPFSSPSAFTSTQFLSFAVTTPVSVPDFVSGLSPSAFLSSAHATLAVSTAATAHAKIRITLLLLDVGRPEQDHPHQPPGLLRRVGCGAEADDRPQPGQDQQRC